MKNLSIADYMEKFIAHARTKAPNLAAVIDTRPEQWVDAVQRLRELCASHNIPEDQELDTVLANIAHTLK